MDNKPKVFISYSWKSEEYKEFVLQLARKLQHDGVDVILDRWHLRPGYDMYVFMEDSIRESDKVLILCEKKYVEKANAREGGAGTETRIISPILYGQSRQEKFIPVFMEGSRIVPDYLRGRYGVHFEKHSEEQYIELYNAVCSKLDGKLLSKPEEDDFDIGFSSLIPSFEDNDHPCVDPSRAKKSDSSLASEYNYEIMPEGIVITKYNGKGGAVVTPPDIEGRPVTALGEEAFADCRELTAITISNNVTKIGDWAFRGCISLSSVTIPDSVISLGIGAFAICDSLLTIVVGKGNPVYYSEDNILYTRNKRMLLACPKGRTVTTVTIPNGVTNVGDRAFRRCTKLISITIPDSVTNLGIGAFWGCTGLTSITIPESVISIGSWAFERCTNLKDVYYSGTVHQWNAIRIDVGNDCLKNATIHYTTNKKPL